MVTLNQLINKKRKQKYRTKKFGALNNNPQKKGTILKLVIRNPKKPNSASRKLALVRLTNSKRIYAYIPGMGHNLQEHSVSLVRAGRTKDLPGIRYKLIRGIYDFSGLDSRKNARSKYGTKKI